MKNTFLMLAHKYNPKKHGIGGWFMSEKLDGMRCYWDGGVTRGKMKIDVDWANHDKDARYKVSPVCTGLWSRYRNIIHAPDWWLDTLPNIPLDGELYIKDFRQSLMSIVKKIQPTGDWLSVKYHVFGLPDSQVPFQSVVGKMQHIKGKYIKIVEQEQLPFSTQEAEDYIDTALNTITDAGGEGLMLRSPASVWEPHRSHKLLKVKRLDDAEGTVIGYTSGRRTSKGSKLLGMMGALIIRLADDNILELSGFTESERQLTDSTYAIQYPGEKLPENVEAICFPLGSMVTFRYRGTTKDGIPQEARYWRKYGWE